MVLWNFLFETINHIFYLVGAGICLALFALAIPNIITVLIEAYIKLWDVILGALGLHKAFLEFYKERILSETIISGEYKKED